MTLNVSILLFPDPFSSPSLSLLKKETNTHCSQIYYNKMLVTESWQLPKVIPYMITGC